MVRVDSYADATVLTIAAGIANCMSKPFFSIDQQCKLRLYAVHWLLLHEEKLNAIRSSVIGQPPQFSSASRHQVEFKGFTAHQTADLKRTRMRQIKRMFVFRPYGLNQSLQNYSLSQHSDHYFYPILADLQCEVPLLALHVRTPREAHCTCTERLKFENRRFSDRKEDILPIYKIFVPFSLQLILYVALDPSIVKVRLKLSNSFHCQCKTLAIYQPITGEASDKAADQILANNIFFQGHNKQSAVVCPSNQQRSRFISTHSSLHLLQHFFRISLENGIEKGSTCLGGPSLQVDRSTEETLMQNNHYLLLGVRRKLVSACEMKRLVDI